MALQDRSYGGKLFRPTPETHVEEDGSFIAIATPWGDRQAAKRAIEVVTDYTLSAREDREATSPFQKLTCLSPLANNLRVATMLANDSIYREENKAEYLSGVELLLISHSEGELAFAQVGSPHFLLARRGLPILPLSVQIDLSTELSESPEMLAPLPQNVIGLHQTTNMNIASVKTQAGDRLIFLSHSVIAPELYTLPFEQVGLDSLTETLSRKYPDLPFWLGIFEF